jgi:hypothetical protein
MKPFPTSFWLVCPYLAKVLGALESAGGVREMERAATGHEKDWLRYDLLHARVRLSTITGAQRAYLSRMRRNLFRAVCRGGVGGVVSSEGSVHVKCLHLQTASYMGLGWHPLSAWLDCKVGKLECGRAMCAFVEEE